MNIRKLNYDIHVLEPTLNRSTSEVHHLSLQINLNFQLLHQLPRVRGTDNSLLTRMRVRQGLRTRKVYTETQEFHRQVSDTGA
jgi:hypothetical protein